MVSKKYLKQLFIMTSSVCLLIIFVLVFSLYFQMRHTLYENELQKSKTLFLKTKSTTETILQNLESTAYSIYQSPVTKQIMYGSNQEINHIIQLLDKVNQEITFNPSVQSVYIYNHSMDTYYSTYKGMYYLDDSFQKMLDLEVKDSDFPLTRKTESGWVLTYKLTDVYYSSSPSDSVYINFDYDWIIDAILASSNESGSSVYILDENLNLVLPSGTQSQYFPTLPEHAVTLLSSAQKDDYGVFQMPVESGEAYVSYTKFAEPDWVLLRATPASDLFRSIEYWQQFISILLAITIVIAGICYIFISRRLYSPINRIVGLLPSGEEPADEFTLFERYVSNQQNELDHLKTDNEMGEQQREEGAIIRLISGNNIMNEHFLQSLYAMYHFKVDFLKPYYVCVGSLDDIENVFTYFAPENEKGLALYALRNILLECLAPLSCDYAYTENDHIIFLFNSDEITNEICKMLQKAQKELHDVLKTTVSFSLIQTTSDIRKVPEQYKKCKESLQDRFFMGRESLITQEMCWESQKSFSEYNRKFEKRLLELLLKHHGGEVTQKERTCIDSFVKEVALLDYPSVRMVLILFVDSLKKQCADETVKIDPLEIDSLADMLTPKEIHFIGDLALVLEKVFEVIGNEQREAGCVQAEIIEKAQAYIQTHYSEYDLCATTLAEYIGVSSPYLGKIFKQQTGKSIPEYINEVRLLKASVWLKNTELSTQEIALNAGYQNSTYFYKVFKQKFGVTPKSYRSNSI